MQHPILGIVAAFATAFMLALVWFRRIDQTSRAKVLMAARTTVSGTFAVMALQGHSAMWLPAIAFAVFAFYSDKQQPTSVS